MTAKNRSVALIGGIPLDSPAEVFDLVGAKLGGLVARMPDGEQASRGGWFAYQDGALEAASALERSPDGVGGGPLPPDKLRELYPDLAEARPELIENALRLFQIFQEKAAEGTAPAVQPLHPFRVKGGVRATDISLGDLGALDIETESYAEFKRAQVRGSVPRDVRYGACFPTPLTYLQIVVQGDDVDTVLPAYEQALGRELGQISEAIPAEDLTVQFDVCDFVAARLERPDLEQLTLPMLLNAQPRAADEIVASLARVCESVPPEVEVGMHFCYGAPGNMHVFQPRDTSVMVDFANRLSRGLGHPIAYIHMPVPKERDDPGYFAPLQGLDIGSTELFLGLLHKSDGLAGAQRRANAASGFVSNFGIATECGWSSHLRSDVPALLDLHAQAAAHI